MELSLLPLGAGQDIGRSCIIMSVAGARVMLDCGAHMGFKDDRRFPDFKMISPAGRYTDVIQAVLITHFHLDHIGALPYFTEVLGYRGPIIMTHATRALAPLMLEDYLNIIRNAKGATYTRQQVADCLARVTCVDLHEPIRVPPSIEVTAYYAGHVLGACMFHCRVSAADLVYTGDYNMTADRHLGAARIPRLRPDVLVTEATYATTVRESRRGREREFLSAILQTVKAGGKVLIPVFALGRAQELTILVDEFWQRMDLTAPIYFSEGMVSRAAALYETFVDWTTQKLKDTASQTGHNPFASSRIKPWAATYLDQPGPCVLFATPGMLHGGLSLDVFKVWSQSKTNLAVLPGYCVAGTVGHQLASSKDKIVQLDRNTRLQVKCKVIYMAFSAHADAKGILQMIQHLEPANVVLVHGEPSKMRFLEQRVKSSLNLPCFAPANGAVTGIHVRSALPVEVSEAALRRSYRLAGERVSAETLSDIAAGGFQGQAALSALIANLKSELASDEDGMAGAERPQRTVQDGSALGQLAADAHVPARGSDANSLTHTPGVTEAASLLQHGNAQMRQPRIHVDGILVAAVESGGTKSMHVVTPDEASQLEKPSAVDLDSREIDRAVRQGDATEAPLSAPLHTLPTPTRESGDTQSLQDEGLQQVTALRDNDMRKLQHGDVQFMTPCTADCEGASGHGRVVLHASSGSVKAGAIDARLVHCRNIADTNAHSP